MIGLVDGAFPSDMVLTSETGLIEEQRLFYVALTRARNELALDVPLRMPHQRHSVSDRHSFAPASRFLTDAALATVDMTQAEPLAPPPRRADHCARRCTHP